MLKRKKLADADADGFRVIGKNTLERSLTVAADGYNSSADQNDFAYGRSGYTASGEKRSRTDGRKALIRAARLHTSARFFNGKHIFLAAFLRLLFQRVVFNENINKT